VDAHIDVNASSGCIRRAQVLARKTSLFSGAHLDLIGQAN